MAGIPKLEPIRAFHDNFADARELLEFADALTNTRKRAMRKELREKVGVSLKVKKGDWGSLDCVESQEMFVVLKPGSRFTRDQFKHQEAMLRQAVVAASTALETYVADKSVEQVRLVIGRTNRPDPLPATLAKLRLRLDTWEKVERFDRRRRAITDHFVRDEIQQRASTHPERVAELLKMTGLSDPLALIDAERGVAVGTTSLELEILNKRRNSIAHSGDRRGRGRAKINPGMVRAFLLQVEDIAEAVERCF